MVRRPSPGRPPGKYTQAVRLFQLYHRLESSPEGMRIDDIARELGVTARSIRRDLKALEGAQIELESFDVENERRVRLARTGRSTEPIRMTRFQRYSLAAVRRVFDVLHGTPMHDDLSQLFVKLVPEKGDGDTHALLDRFVFIPEAPKNYRKFKDSIYEVYDGVLQNRTLSFTYDGGSTPGPRKMEPYALVLYRNGLYVVGKDVAKKAPRTFALERMRRVRALPQQAFERDPNFDVSKMFDGAFGLIATGERVHVVVEFEKRVATYIEEREWHPSQKLTPLDDGGVRCEFEVAMGEELVGWVLRWGASAKVIAPAELIERMRSEFSRAGSQYDDGAGANAANAGAASTGARPSRVVAAS